MKVLLVGSGGREDALAWAISRSPLLGELRCAPGSAGIGCRAGLVPIAATAVDELIDHARREAYDLVVIGPEQPLVCGVADRLREAGLTVFGPSAGAARLEGSKVFAKAFLDRHRIPTASWRAFDDLGEARGWLSSSEAVYPLVIKADGLAAGKGVVLADERASALEAAEGMLSGRSFGVAGERIVVENRLYGREVSFFVLADGERWTELATCQDYKRAFDDDRGPNTGGMGACSPSVWLDEATRRILSETIVGPTLDGLAADGHPYRGVLYVGAMLTEAGPSVLEFNARFGDPETQVLLPRLDGDWLEWLAAAAAGCLPARGPAWRTEAAVCVVLASAGYPGAYETGQAITGLDAAATFEEDTMVFHAGTRRSADGSWTTAGGRVLGVTALGPDLPAARVRAYEAVERIHWPGMHFRRDIARDAAERVEAER